jgi:putative ABC transport system substrate-binding protein
MLVSGPSGPDIHRAGRWGCIILKRREFVRRLASAAFAWPLVARAQQPALPVVGFLNSGSAGPLSTNLRGFLQGLSEAGYVEGRNVAIEQRWADGDYDRLPQLAADLVGRKVSALAATGGLPSALAAKAATRTIPIVFVMGSDPVKAGVVASLNRPGGNVTGVSFLTNTLGAKRVEFLSQLVPKAATIGILANPTNPDAEMEINDASAALTALGRKLFVVKASTENNVDAAFATLAAQRVGGLVVAGDPFFAGNARPQIIALAARHRIPAMYAFRDDPIAGGLSSYGSSLIDAYRQVGVYVGSILKGTKPADIPVIQSTKFEFVLNLKTAQALGLTVPQTLLLRADEVIQ